LSTRVAPTTPRARLRAVAAASVGNALEWYDFTIYALFAIQIGNAFFPDADGTVAVLKAFLAFGVGFIARPVGAVLIGIYADRSGRKAALTLTILLMAAGTLTIAIAPTYAQVGAVAPFVIVVGRLLQGLSAGGEIGGAAAYLVEQAPPGQRSRYAAWLQASMACSNILGALVAFLVNSLLSADEVAAWGWRIPFVSGLLIAPVGLWLRRRLDETPEFAGLASPEEPAVLRHLKGHGRSLAIGFGLSVLWAVSVYTLVIFLPIHVQRALGVSATDAFAASLVANAVFVAGCLWFGILADRLGRRILLGGGAAAMLLLVPPLLLLLSAAPGLVMLIVVQSLFCLMVAAFSACAPAALVALFPVRIRATGMSVTYNGAVTLFGGFAPAILTWLAASGAGVLAPAWYVAAAAIAALVAVAALAPGSDH
jgi:MHS family proline/betaine transporter-like MFS transporter